ncbi:hypothetical protein E4U14_003990 [Claviceps sp. LM454 group G7]|nr:hypothetical protein E4U14_003990 [Claviceps sp. LM454 group G7]
MDKIARNLSNETLSRSRRWRTSRSTTAQIWARRNEYTSIFHVAPNLRRAKARSAIMSCLATLLLRNSTFTAPNVINKIDPNLKTLFYKIVPEADDPVLAAIPTQILQVPAKASRDRVSYQ